MYCPRCSQKQVSGQTRFCSNCGLPLGLIAEVLKNGGSLPELSELYKNKKILTRKNGLIFTLFWFLFFVLIMTPFFGILDIDVLAGISALSGTMGGLILLISSFVFLEKSPRHTPEFLSIQASPEKDTISANEQNEFLLPPQKSTAREFTATTGADWKSADTGKLTGQPSVTEETTKLLSKDQYKKQ